MLCIICHLSPVSEQSRGSQLNSGMAGHLRTEGIWWRNVVAWREKSSLLFSSRMQECWATLSQRTRRRFNDQKMWVSCNMCCYFVKPACTAVLWRESASWLWREEVRILHRRVCEQQDDREDIELDCNNFDGQLKEEKGSWMPVSHTVSRNKWRAENICWRRLYRNRVVKFANTY